MIGTRKVTLGGLDYELSETQPDIFQLRELPDGPVLGSYTRVASHGRFKETFRIIGTDASYTSEKEMWYLLQMRYWRNRAETADPVPPLDTTGWLPAVAAASAYGLTQTALLAAIRDGSIPAQRQADGKWLVAPPAAQPAPVAAKPAPPNARIARAQAIFTEPDPPPEPEPPASPLPPPTASAASEPAPVPDTTGWFTTSEVAKYYGVSDSQVSALIRNNVLPAQRVPIHPGNDPTRKGEYAWRLDPAQLPDAIPMRGRMQRPVAPPSAPASASVVTPAPSEPPAPVVAPPVLPTPVVAPPDPPPVNVPAVTPAPPTEAEPDITDWLSVAGAAAASGVTRSAVQFWLKDGRIRAVKRGSAWWIDPASLPQPNQTIAEVAPKDPAPNELIVPAGWLRTRDAARAYGISLTAIGEWAQQGKVPALKAPGPTGKIWWIAPPEVATPAPVPTPPVEPLAEVTPPAPPMNGNGAAHTEPVAPHLLPPDPTLITAIRDEARRAGRAEAEAAYLRAELARAQQDQARRRWPWSR